MIYTVYDLYSVSCDDCLMSFFPLILLPSMCGTDCLRSCLISEWGPYPRTLKITTFLPHCYPWTPGSVDNAALMRMFHGLAAGDRGLEAITVEACFPIGNALVFSASDVNAYVFGDENSMCLKCVSDVFAANFAFVIMGCVRRYML